MGTYLYETDYDKDFSGMSTSPLIGFAGRSRQNYAASGKFKDVLVEVYRRFPWMNSWISAINMMNGTKTTSIFFFFLFSFFFFFLKEIT